MTDDLKALNDETRQMWDIKAAFWDELHGDDGNTFHRNLVGPAAERLLAVQPGETVLDVACGNGVFARRLAELGARVVATDFSANLIERAKARSAPGTIDYRVVDATDEAALLDLGAGRFDAAVCNMAIMDIADINPMLRAMRQLLKPEGRFVYTLMHPCFNSPAVALVLEESDRDGQLVEILSTKADDYLNIGAVKMAGAVGEPSAHYLFHRTLTELMRLAASHGFVMDAIDEPAFPPDAERGRRRISWGDFTKIPPVFGARLRPLRID